MEIFCDTPFKKDKFSTTSFYLKMKANIINDLAGILQKMSFSTCAYVTNFMVIGQIVLSSKTRKV